MPNLLEETKDTLKLYGCTLNDIVWVGIKEGYIPLETFIKHADFEYDDVILGQRVPTDLVVVGKDFIMARKEYSDGDRWEYYSIDVYQKPQKELKIISLISSRWDTLKAGCIDMPRILDDIKTTLKGR